MKKYKLIKEYLLGLSYFIIGTGIFFWTGWPGLVIYIIGYLVGILLGYEYGRYSNIIK